MLEMIEKKECAACRREIDVTARICPYCGANPESGRRFDPAPILQSHFPMKDPRPKARVAEFLRERQGLVVGALAVAVLLLIGAAHQFVTRRNQALESSAPAVPLTDLADLNQRGEEQKELPIPEIEFTWTGRPETMEVLLVEPGAVAPPPPAQPAGSTAPAAKGPSQNRPAPPPTPAARPQTPPAR